MSFLTAHFLSNISSKLIPALSLSHLKTLKGEVLFACVCDSVCGDEYLENTAKYAAEYMSEWFYNEALKLIEKGGSKTRFENAVLRMSERLSCTLAARLKDGGNTKLKAGAIIIFKNQYIFFNMGDCTMYRIADTKLKSKEIFKHGIKQNTEKNHNAINIVWGRLKLGDGIILATKDYYQNIKESELITAFGKDTVNDEKYAACMLRETGERTAVRSGENISAIYIKYIH